MWISQFIRNGYSPREDFETFKEHLRAEHRNYWWNPDFVALLVERLDLSSMRHILDVGCGCGHWTRELYPHVGQSAEIIGIDSEPLFLEEAAERTRVEFGAKARIAYREGSVYALPYEDEMFDLVTCQFLLMHLANPEAALKEMVRLLRPGGRLVLVEPNKTAHLLNSNSALDTLSVEEKCALARLHILCGEGKMKKGRGFEDIGLKLPTLLNAFPIGLEGVYNSDKVFYLNPPYSTPEQLSLISFLKQLFTPMCFNTYTYEKGREYFLAVQDDEKEFDRLWKVVEKYNQECYLQLKEERLSGAFGATIMITIAQKL